MTTITQEEIATRIPHRYENLLLDKTTLVGDSGSEFSLNVLENDPLGRQIFAYAFNNANVLPTPILAEIAALACIVSSGAIKPGTFAYFAAITNFSITGTPFSAFSTINGSTEKLSDKNGFHKYSFRVETDNSEASGQLMAYYDTDGGSESQLPQVSNLSDAFKHAITSEPGTPIDPFGFKAETMTFVHSVHLATDDKAVYSYQYPIDHPFTKGHFPKNPVMMGVCQWQMLEDAISDYVKRQNITSDFITINATIIKYDQTPVCDIKKATMSILNNTDETKVTTTSVKKVMFKQRVFPGDTLFVLISDITK